MARQIVAARRRGGMGGNVVRPEFEHALRSGTNLQGVSAPALTGASFARSNLTLSQLRTIVTTQMPLGNPGSLSPQQYAAVIAFLLQYDCISPANNGKTPFLTQDTPLLHKVKVSGATCPVR